MSVPNYNDSNAPVQRFSGTLDLDVEATAAALELLHASIATAGNKVDHINWIIERDVINSLKNKIKEAASGS